MNQFGSLPILKSGDPVKADDLHRDRIGNLEDRVRTLEAQMKLLLDWIELARLKMDIIAAGLDRR